MSGNKAQEEGLQEFVEERNFFRSLVMTDPQIADRLGICWDSYRARFRRHPELGPICDPRDLERKNEVGWIAILRHRRPRSDA